MRATVRTGEIRCPSLGTSAVRQRGTLLSVYGENAVAADNGTVSLRPSIGNWQLPCRSHYFIVRNRVVWASDHEPGSPETTGGTGPLTTAVESEHRRSVLVPTVVAAGVAALAVVAIDMPWARLTVAAAVAGLLYAAVNRQR